MFSRVGEHPRHNQDERDDDRKPKNGVERAGDKGNRAADKLHGKNYDDENKDCRDDDHG